MRQRRSSADVFFARDGSDNYEEWGVMLAWECWKARAALAAPSAEPRDSNWFALVMGAAAEIENAANCLRDEDARRTALSGARHYRDKANALFAASLPRVPPEGPKP